MARWPQAPSALTLDAALDGRLELINSPRLLQEIASVLARPRLQKYLSADEALRFITGLAAQTTLLADPRGPHPAVCRDSQGDYLVALATASGAEAIVTGDLDLLAIDHDVSAQTCRSRPRRSVDVSYPPAESPPTARGRRTLTAEEMPIAPDRCFLVAGYGTAMFSSENGVEALVRLVGWRRARRCAGSIGATNVAFRVITPDLATAIQAVTESGVEAVHRVAAGAALGRQTNRPPRCG